MKKLLFLGGSFSQVPAILKAKEMGYFVITCDYLPNNPGHKISDKYVNISTVDKEAVLSFALKEGIDGISAYASDPAAETAAYVSEKMELPGTGYEATRILAEKDLFRQFQKGNNFNVPNFTAISGIEELKNIDMSEIGFPCFVKPVDSSGSKGVTEVGNEKELQQAAKTAFEYSRCGRVIIEKKNESPYHQFHGDGFVYNGKLVFIHMGQQHFHNSVPIGSGCPCIVSPELNTLMEAEIARLIERVQFKTGAINVEIRINNHGEVFIIEIGPRSGGNYIPQLMEASTGFDEVSACILGSMENTFEFDFSKRKQEYTFQYIVGSYEQGKFKELWINPLISDRVKACYIHKKVGDELNLYQNSSGVVGVVIISFDTEKEMNYVIEHIREYVNVICTDC